MSNFTANDSFNGYLLADKNLSHEKHYVLQWDIAIDRASASWEARKLEIDLMKLGRLSCFGVLLNSQSPFARANIYLSLSTQDSVNELDWQTKAI